MTMFYSNVLAIKGSLYHIWRIMSLFLMECSLMARPISLHTACPMALNIVIYSLLGFTHVQNAVLLTVVEMLD